MEKTLNTIFKSGWLWQNICAPTMPVEVAFVLLILAILTKIRWNLKVVLISLMAKDVEHF